MACAAALTWPDAVALSVGAICFVVFLLAAMFTLVVAAEKRSDRP
jgi:hypothetical protein